ncbi:MAG: hypothetical protein ACK4N5_07640, partial [Myxococcales bacterium]
MPVPVAKTPVRPPVAPAPAAAPVAPAAPAAPRTVSKVRVDDSGAVFATISGSEVKLASHGIKAWVLGNGRYVVWSGRDGGGGYENEGQSLRVFDVQARTYTKVMAETVMIDDVQLMPTRGKSPALLVSMSDGGLGASHFAVVDPLKAKTVYRQPMAKALDVKDGKVTVGLYTEDDFHASELPTPKKTKTVDVNALFGAPSAATVRGTPAAAPPPAAPAGTAKRKVDATRV